MTQHQALDTLVGSPALVEQALAALRARLECCSPDAWGWEPRLLLHFPGRSLFTPYRPQKGGRS